MRTVNFRDDVVFAVAYQLGIDPRANFLSDQSNSFVSFINIWVRRIWNRVDWPEWTVIEQRTPDANHFVPFDQSGQNPIGKVYRVYVRNPNTTPGPLDTPFRLLADGIFCGFEHGATVWIKFAKPAPRYTFTPWQSTITYGLGDLVYDPTSGNVYIGKTSTGNLNKAFSNGTYWDLVPFPEELVDVVVRGAAANALRDEGKFEAAASEEQNANAQSVEKAAEKIAQDFDAITDQAGNNGRARYRSKSPPAAQAQ